MIVNFFRKIGVRNRPFWLSLVLIAQVSLGFAHPVSDEYVVSDRFGKLTVYRGSEPYELRFNGKKIYQQEGVELTDEKKFSFDDSEVILFSDEPGDKECPTRYFFVVIRAGGSIRITPEFGACMTTYISLEKQGDKVVFLLHNWDDAGYTEYVYYAMGSLDGTLTENGNVITTSSAPIHPEPATYSLKIQLLPGYKAAAMAGMDSNPGWIWKKGGPAIRYDIGQLAGHWVQRQKAREFLWYQEKNIDHQTVLIAFTKQHTLMVTFLEPSANFVATKVDSKQVMDEIISMVLTYRGIERN
jgi:hypothetical protein